MPEYMYIAINCNLKFIYLLGTCSLLLSFIAWLFTQTLAVWGLLRLTPAITKFAWIRYFEHSIQI